MLFSIPFAPVVEHGHENSAFLAKHPAVVMNDGTFNKVPLMTGFNEDEAALISSQSKLNFLET